MKRELIVLYIAMFILMFGVPVNAAIITVCSAACSSTTVQGGIDIAALGDEVRITDSRTYNENVSVNQSITLTTTASPVIFINSTNSTITVLVDNVTISFLTVVYNATGGSKAAVDLTGRVNITLKNNTIRTQASGSTAITGTSTNSSFLLNNTIVTNGTGAANVGLYFFKSFNNTIAFNIINTNSSGGGSNTGIRFETGSINNTINNNTIVTGGDNSNQGIYLYADSSSYGNNKIFGNLINTSGVNAYSDGIHIYRLSDNLIANNTIYTVGRADSAGETISGIYLRSNSPSNILDNNRIHTDGYGENYGIYLFNDDDSTNGPKNNTITNNTINSTGSFLSNHGIFLKGAANNSIIGNNITIGYRGSSYGIYVLGDTSGGVPSNYNHISNNTIKAYTDGSSRGILLNGANLADIGLGRSNDNTKVEYNHVDMLSDGSDEGFTVQSSPGMVGLEIRNNTFIIKGQSNVRGINSNAPNTKIVGNTIQVNGTSGQGIYIQQSGQNVINNTISSSNASGVYAFGVLRVNITENKITLNGLFNAGIRLDSGTNSTRIINNTITSTLNSSSGVYIIGSNDTLVVNNTIKASGNNSFAVQIENNGANSPTNNVFYNNIFNTTAKFVNITVTSVNNFSTDLGSAVNIIGGSSTGGNFYDNSSQNGQPTHSLTCADVNLNGICDTSLSFGSNNLDFYPLAKISNPTIIINGTNFTNIRKGQVGQFWFNLSSGTSNPLSFLMAEHNMTSDGVAVNISVPLTSTKTNTSVNITMLFGNTTAFYVKPYFNDSAGQINNTVPRAFYVTSNTPPVVSNVKINNTPLTISKDANGSASYSDVDNNSQQSVGFRWFVNGGFTSTGNDQSLFLKENYTTDDQVIVSIRFNDGTDWGDWVNSSTVIVGDATRPLIPNFILQYSSLDNTAGNTNNFTINGTDGSSNILTINFSLNISSGSVVDRSMVIPSGQKSVNVSYKIFESQETLSIGSYNITNIRVCDSSNNCNSTSDISSFPSWSGVTFSVTQAPGSGGGSTSSGGGGGGGGGGCKSGETNVAGVCVSTESITANLTRAPRCGDGFCDAFAGENFIQCSKDCQFESKFFTCSDPEKPCFFQNKNYVVYTILALLAGGLLYLSEAQKPKTKKFLREAKQKLRFWRRR